jgi:hypothetical protein
MRLNIVRRSEVAESFRVAAVRGLFDLPDSGLAGIGFRVRFGKRMMSERLKHWTGWRGIRVFMSVGW